MLLNLIQIIYQTSIDEAIKNMKKFDIGGGVKNPKIVKMKLLHI